MNVDSIPLTSAVVLRKPDTKSEAQRLYALIKEGNRVYLDREDVLDELMDLLAANPIPEFNGFYRDDGHRIVRYSQEDMAQTIGLCMSPFP